MSTRNRTVIATVLLAVSFLPAWGASVPPDRPVAQGWIPWRSGGSATVRSAPTEVAAAVQAVQDSGARHLIVQFEQPVTNAVRRQLETAGLRLLAYLGDNAFFAGLVGDQPDVAALTRVPTLRTALEIETSWKMHATFLRGDIPEWAVVSPPKVNRDVAATIVAVCVLFHPDVALASDAVPLCLQHGATVRSLLRSVNGAVVELPLGNLAALAREDAVQWIEPPLPRLSAVNDDVRARTGADLVQAPPYNLDGSGVTVLVYDAGTADASHPDFGGRVHMRDDSGTISHATHVSGTIGGDGTQSAGVWRGMAPAVTIESYGFQQEGGLHEGFLYTDPGDIEQDYGEAINAYGADIANNSIGTNTAYNGFPCDWEGDYGVTDTVIDAIVRGSLGAPFRIVWAAGNERASGRCGSAYHTTAPPANAKNHISVGALNSNDDSVTYFTSWGPADDGRLKPDLAAPGCQTDGDGGVTSCNAGGGYATMCGTSMASPTVCGLSALLLQDYRDQFPGQPDFRNSTLKVLLAQTAVDLGNVGPDYQFGYGSVRIQPSIDFMRSGSFLEGAVSQGETASVLVLVNPGDQQLKVTLAWDDVPGTPNVSPALVNDLDLRVFDAAQNQYYPWTLDPANPGTPAVRTQPDHVNNIEQVVIDVPAPGTYHVEVYGYSVPSGPQAFSLAASPTLVACSSQGVITLDRAAYACESTAVIEVIDCDLNTDDNVVETVPVLVASGSEPAGETVILTETGPETAVFRGTAVLSTTDAPGVLLVADGQTVTATYLDADNGLGGINVLVTDTALVDCQFPVISNVQTTEVRPRQATVAFNTNEMVLGSVHLGLSCDALNEELPGSGYQTSHTVLLTGLEDNTTYYYAIAAEDQAGNLTLDDHWGGCYTFTTPAAPDAFTEQFSHDNDLDFSAFLWTPNGSIDYYAACRNTIGLLPVDPVGGTVLSLTDDSYVQVTLNGGASVSHYGVAYNSFYVGSNGYITFGVGDTDQVESLAKHFALPRISALYDDLAPETGRVSWKQLADRAVVTFEDVAEYGTSNYDTFQFELFFDGRIRVSYLNLDALDGIAGLSDGAGLPADFAETDLSALAGCGPRPPYVCGAETETPPDTPLSIVLAADDDGLPDPPGSLIYVVTSLPVYELRDAGNDHLIVPSDLPYTLVGGGNEVVYTPSGGYVGTDGFQFIANDGGNPPSGGDSGLGTVSIYVREPVPDYFTEYFEWLVYNDLRYRSVTFSPNGSPDFYAACVEPITDLPADPAGGTPVLLGDEDYEQVLVPQGQQVWLYGVSYNTFFIGSNGWVTFGAGDASGVLTLAKHFQLPRISGVGDDLEPNIVDPNISWKQLPDRIAVTYDNVWEWWFFGGGPSTFQIEMFFDGRIRISFLSIGASCCITGLSAGQGLPPDFEETDFSRLGCHPAPPRAYDVDVTTTLNTPVMVTLHAEDDGLPNPPGALEYTILTLPFGGSLHDPVGGEITAVPYTLSNYGHHGEYVPSAGFGGADHFEYKANDGGVPYDGGDSNVAIATIYVSAPRLICRFTLDADPGWTTEGLWAFGPPLGLGSHNHDPTSGYTGVNVYGYNLAGDYENNLPPTHLTTTPIDCSQLGATELRFRRWLGLETAWFDHARIEVSSDGVNWATVWNHTGVTIAETAWSLQTYDISQVADGQPTVYIRWTMGPTNLQTTYPGWNLDDVEIWALAPMSYGAGDLNCDGLVGFGDINPFVLLLSNPAAWQATYPDCPILNGDINGDGAVDFGDINPFVALLSGGG